ncbi:MAG: amino acid ABC transporter substrate-binding protein, partial [Hyphomicrobiales bacterium]|nr:amino acid ABC transporter substrate-binding protein [Hyphomicrobiales bacterium]
MNRREIVLGGASAAALIGATGLRAQQPAEVVIGAVYQMSGASAQVGVDAQHAFDTALDVINNSYDLDLPLAKNAGLAG